MECYFFVPQHPLEVCFFGIGFHICFASYSFVEIFGQFVTLGMAIGVVRDHFKKQKAMFCDMLKVNFILRNKL